jgi:D-arabinose 1-dehydrogenase-like Zn-dependent alcohol dehydrogenase
MAQIDAWVAATAKEKLVRQKVDLGPLADEDVEVRVEHCGLCHSDLSMLANEFAARHKITPQTEHMPMRRINEAFERLEAGKARYRIVLDADS